MMGTAGAVAAIACLLALCIDPLRSFQWSGQPLQIGLHEDSCSLQKLAISFMMARHAESALIVVPL